MFLYTVFEGIFLTLDQDFIFLTLVSTENNLCSCCPPMKFRLHYVPYTAMSWPWIQNSKVYEVGLLIIPNWEELLTPSKTERSWATKSRWPCLHTRWPSKASSNLKYSVFVHNTFNNGELTNAWHYFTEQNTTT